MKKTCVITNIGAHYRFPIFQLMSEELNCDFYLGDKVESPIKTFVYKKLKGYKASLHNIFFHHFYWQSHSVGLIKQDYEYYILDGEPYCLSSWAILLLARLRGKVTVSWSHGWYGRERGLKRIIKKVFYSLFSKLMLYNEYAINLMEKEGFDRKKMFCIANSMDSDEDLNIRKTLHKTNVYKDYFHNDYPTIIYCGRVQHRKKLEQVLDAIQILKNKGQVVNFMVIGKDVDGVNLADLASSKGISRQLWIYGPCYDDGKLGELFYNAAVCVSPGNIGLTAIHAMSFGCPCITHNNFLEQMPEFEAIKTELTGDFFEQDNTTNLAFTIGKWIGKDKQEREVVRQQCFSEVDRKWNIHHQIDVIKQVLNAN
ncbi:hypothetical protein PRBRB14_24710 [Hallella multisaccharivorax DSM 17128]|uniref:Glycosyl transferase group 1 n=1 Tax=Hallella multisaccharivorax DSM 17128 TaxID=688246 RepID=F8N5Y2_9BACT|nr:glycosyltransferase [Hallella multisaccharivorax]EGN57166.1 glycosyl transferase group 1 [Hallella multisaccharivorax DSM 17128]GJG31592.1 hypothetical protein PRBRB14_24710 [Hallella multisaccharivorax DSM 17128]